MKQKKMKQGMRFLSMLLMTAMLFSGIGLPVRAENIFSGTAEKEETGKLTELEGTPEDAPEVDINALIKKGTDAAAAYIENAHQSKDYAYNDEWDIYSLLRMGRTIEESQLEKYYQSVEEKVKTWEKTTKPTDIERAALALQSMGKDITDVGGVSLAEMIYNHPNLDSGSNELLWALLALDAKETVIPENAKWTRNKIVDALLKFQNEETGGFGLFDHTMTSVDATAMSIQALAKYCKTDEKVQRAVEKGVRYLKNSMSESYDYDNSNSVSQVLLTLAILGIDPLNSEFGTPSENMITVLMERYYSETAKGNGFTFLKGDRLINKMATVQALQALTAYSQREDGKSYWDLTDEREAGTVAVAIMDGIRHNTSLNLLLNSRWNVWELDAKGTMLQVELPIYESDSMMTVIERACKQNGLEIEIVGGEYISSIDGLSEFDRGSGSGWKGTLNGDWPDRGFHTITVENGELKNGDSITVEYTMNLGKDLTENADLKSISVNGGTLQKEYERNVYAYGLEIEKDVKEVRIQTETFNRYAKVEILAEGHLYQEGEAVPVEDGTEIVITSTKAVRGQETKTYKLTVKQEKAENPKPEQPDTEQPDTEQPQKKETTLTDAQYGVSLTGDMLTEDMQLIVSKLTKEDAAVDVIRDAIPSSKGVFGLYHVTLIQNGREITLSGSADLKLPIGEKYNGKTMDVLLHNSGTIEKLTGKAADGYLTVKVKKLGDFGVVTEMPDSTEEATNPSAQSGAGNGQSGTVKTGDRMQTVYFVYLLAACVAGTCIVIGKKRRQGK